MARVLIVGADGLIGADLYRRLRRRGHRVIGTSRRPDSRHLPLDLARPPAKVPSVDAAVICAAVARLELCEADPVGSRLVNVHGAVALARRLTAAGASVVFLSTDKVLDGRHARRSRYAPWRPLTEYGRQKAAAERALLALPGTVAVLRLSKVLDASLPLLQGWADALRAGRSVDAFADMYLAPVDLPRIATLVETLIAARARGIFHCTGAEDRPYVALARALAAACGAPGHLVRPVPADPVRHPLAARPRHSSLEMRLEQRRFGIAQPGFDAVVDPVARMVSAALTVQRTFVASDLATALA